MNRQRPLILIVDDEPFNVDYLEQELEELGYDTVAAADGLAALEQVAATAPDVVLLDIMMPRLDGFGVLSRLKADPAQRQLPVIIISANDDMDSIVRGIEMGAEDFLPKPFDPVILAARLSSSVEKKRLRDQEQMYLQSLERELEIGRQIQAGFLPQTIPQPGNWEVAAHFAAAREVAGDFYDVFFLPESNHLALLVGDVSDKGVGAALFMTLFRSLLRAAVSPDAFGMRGVAAARDAARSLRHSVQLTNNYIFRMHGETCMFATLFFGFLDPATGELLYVNAGQEPGIVANASGIKAQLAATGPVVGIIEGMDYQVAETRLAPGDLLLLFSDGVTDAQNEAHTFFGRDRILAQFAPFPETAPALLARIKAQLAAHTGSMKQFDDITLLAVYRQPPGNADEDVI
jgi:serine phosphatase RsbU (regulator of sigma subunit)